MRDPLNKLMSIEHIILALCILFGLMLIKIAWDRFRNKQLFRCWLSFSSGVFLLSISSVFIVFITDYDTFQRLTREHPVANIEFHNLGQHHFQAILTKADAKPIFMEIHGDQWQLDARIIKWNGAAAWSGLKPMYRLERVGGRYKDVALEQHATRSVYSLEQGLTPSFWNFLIDYQEFIPWLDAYYGSATYLPMSHGAKFDISISSTGLIARPGNEPARQSVRNWLAQH